MRGRENDTRTEKQVPILWCGSVFDSAAIVAAPKGKGHFIFWFNEHITTTKNDLKHQRLKNMDVLKNALPLIIVPLIRKLPFAKLFYTWIKKCNSSINESWCFGLSSHQLPQQVPTPFSETVVCFSVWIFEW